MKHKTKLFKDVFESNADTCAGLTDAKESVMTQETFVPLMGQMWAKTKAQYKKRYQQKALQFVEWAATYYKFTSKGWVSKLEKKEKIKTTEELFEDWKKKVIKN